MDQTVKMSKCGVFSLTILVISTLQVQQSSGSVSVGANIGIPDLFKPSSQYHYVKQSYPYYLDEYQYRQLSTDKNYFDDEDEDEILYELGEISELDEIDRQTDPSLVNDNGGQLFGGLTPLLFTSALVVGLRYSNIVVTQSQNLTVSSSVPSLTTSCLSTPLLPTPPCLSDSGPCLSSQCFQTSPCLGGRKGVSEKTVWTTSWTMRRILWAKI